MGLAVGFELGNPTGTRRLRAARRAALLACALVALVALVGCSHQRGPDHKCGARCARTARHGFTSDASTIQVVTTQIGGKNVFVPSTIVVTSGVPHTLSIFNTTDAPHGFRIPGLGIEAVLPSQEETAVELPALDGRQLLQINCHLHPPHRTATLVVLP